MVAVTTYDQIGVSSPAPPPADDLFQSIRKQSTTPPLAVTVLEAVTATIRAQEHAPTPTAYFGALMAMFERTDMNDGLAEGDRC